MTASTSAFPGEPGTKASRYLGRAVAVTAPPDRKVTDDWQYTGGPRRELPWSSGLDTPADLPRDGGLRPTAHQARFGNSADQPDCCWPRRRSATSSPTPMRWIRRRSQLILFAVLSVQLKRREDPRPRRAPDGGELGGTLQATVDPRLPVRWGLDRQPRAVDPRKGVMSWRRRPPRRGSVA
ncbi:hypothetical protein HBB16_12865 [Pseudonocardia sp. MCCB 268]|nr:hypothetical protein [Pseudonocardia cytotoxica]